MMHDQRSRPIRLGLKINSIAASPILPSRVSSANATFEPGIYSASMPIIQIATLINATPELCFDLARNIDVHMKSTRGTDEKAVGGVTGGLISLGEEVTWEATHLGRRRKLTSRITAFDRPDHFRDSQVNGPFARFDHDHFFSVESESTLMRDVFSYESPFGWVGRCADYLFLRSYLASFLERRAKAIQQIAERGRLG
jgi:ligand-binding SRPBCC domain-containing protein